MRREIEGKEIKTWADEDSEALDGSRANFVSIQDCLAIISLLHLNNL